LAIFDNNLPNNKRNEQLINITLEPMEQRNDSSPPIEPISRTELPEPPVHNETVPNDIILPKIEKLSNLSNIDEQKFTLPDSKPIVDISPQVVETPAEAETNLALSTPDRLHEPSHQQSLEPVSPVEQELTQITPPPQQPSKTSLPEMMTRDRRQSKEIEPVSPVEQELTQITPPPPQPSKTSLPETINKDKRQTEEIDTVQTLPIIQNMPPEVNKPLPQESAPVEEIVELVEEETDLNASVSLNDSVAKEYATILHNTLNKRVKRKYPRKALQNCIEGTVTVQIQISPSGEQLAYDILNANEAPSILKKATEKILNQRRDFSSFNEDLSDQPMTFQVNLVYRLPQCAK
jgi:hypothetical protein